MENKPLLPGRFRSVPVIAAVGVVLTVAAFLLTQRAVNQYNLVRFESASRQIVEEIDFRMETYVNALIQTRGFLAASASVSREEFRTYVQSIRLARQYPGIQGVGWTVRIRRQELESTVAKIRREEAPDFTVWPSGEREDYTAILYLEPADWRNQRAFGYDMATEPSRQAAMYSARDTGHPVATSVVTLVQETEADRQPGFLIYIPVYRKGVPLETVEQRRAALRGYVYSPFRCYDLFRTTFSDRRIGDHGVEFEIYDGDTPTPDRLLFDYTGEKLRPDSPLYRQVILPVANHAWTIALGARPEFFSPLLRALPWLVALLVGGFMGLLAWLKGLSEKAERARLAAELLSRKSKFLADASAALGATLDYRLALGRVAQFCVPAIASGCTVDLLADDGHYQQLALVHQDPAKEPLYRELRLRYPLGAEVLRKTEYVPEINEEAIRTISRDADHARMLRELGFRSLLRVPLIWRERSLGVISMISDDRKFDANDVAMAAELARRAALAIDNASLYESAQNAIRVRDEFLSIASHELKTPITPLTLQMQMLHRQIKAGDPEATKPERVMKVLEMSIRSVSRLTKLIDDLLDVSRIMNGRLRFRMTPSNLTAIVQDVVARYTSEFAQAGCTLNTRYDKDTDGIWDPLRIEQVVVNLLSNALKYGAGKPVSVNVIRRAETVALVVRDQGIGIEPEDQERIFKRFERAFPDSSISGLGLGLYIVKMIVDGHRGRIWVESKPGEGSEFTIELPLSATGEPVKAT